MHRHIQAAFFIRKKFFGKRNGFWSCFPAPCINYINFRLRQLYLPAAIDILHVDCASIKKINFSFNKNPRSLKIPPAIIFSSVMIFRSSSFALVSSGCSAWYSRSRYPLSRNKLVNTVSFAVRFGGFRCPSCPFSMTLSFVCFS